MDPLGKQTSEAQCSNEAYRLLFVLQSNLCKVHLAASGVGGKILLSRWSSLCSRFKLSEPFIPFGSVEIKSYFFTSRTNLSKREILHHH